MKQSLMNPSRNDAIRLNRTEKIAMMWLYQAATVLCELQNGLSDERIGMVENGRERMEKLSADVEQLVDDLRVTIPENQRMNIHNTSLDCEMRLTPKATPSSVSVVIQKEEFRELVDFARVQCLTCTYTDTECEERCSLYKLLTSILPLDEYHSTFLCPYNMGEWKN